MRYLISFSLILFLLSCVEQTPMHDDIEMTIEDLIAQEKLNEDRAKYGAGMYDVGVEADVNEVAKIKAGIDRKRKKEALENEISGVEKSLATKYKEGDESVLTELIKQLKGPWNDEKRTAFYELSPNYDEPEFIISNQPLLNVIFENIYRGGDEEDRAVQLAGYNKLTGFQTVFEKRLLSGKSDEEARIIFWLGKEKVSMEVVEYVCNGIFESPDDSHEPTSRLGGLYNFCQNGEPNIIEKIMTTALKIYDEKIVTEEQFEETRTSYSSANPAIDLMSILFNYGDERVLPIAEEFYEEDLGRGLALECLLRLEGEKHQPKMVELLNDEEDFMDGIRALKVHYNKEEGKALLPLAVQNFEKFEGEEVQEHLISNIIETVIKVDSANVWEIIEENISSKSLLSRIEKVYELEQITASEIVDYLIEGEFISEEFGENKLNDLEFKHGKSCIYEILELAKIQLWFDTETGFLPVDYAELISDYAAISSGVLDDMEVWMDWEAFDDYENIEYEVTVIYKGVAFSIEPEDIGDWYDVDYLTYFLNYILEYNEFEEQFIFLDTGDQTAQFLFGKPEAVQALIQKFSLNNW
ncbi:MAG: hypothetical protein ACI8ZM_004949 [Crocinitomix sp.]|jgi:hypothetical protein